MASIERSVEREVEVDLIPSENKPEISVKVEQPHSGNEKQNNCSSFLTCYKPLPKPLYNLLRFLLCVCLAPVIYVGVTVATFTVLPLVLGAFVLVRLLQFVIKSDVFGKHYSLKILLRYWIFLVVLSILVEVGLFYPIAKYSPGVKLVVIIGLPITKWIQIVCILIGLYLINQVIWLSIFFIFDDDDQNRAIVMEGASEIFGCMLFLLAEVIVMKSVPTFRESKIFGVPTRKWIKVSLFVLIGYNIITLLAHVFVWFVPKIFGDNPKIGEKLDTALSFISCDGIAKGAFNKKYVVYVAIGIKRSIIFILTAVMLLITWVLYFDNHLNTTPRDKRILSFGTWTFVSIFLWSFLWLIKSCILLYWEAHTLYDRLHSKITEIGKQLYFLVLLSHTHSEYLQQLNENIAKQSDDYTSCFDTPSENKALWVHLDSNSEGEIYQISDRKKVRDELINHASSKVSTYAIKQAAQRFLTAQYAFSKESISCELDHLQIKNTEEDNASTLETVQEIGDNSDVNNANTVETITEIGILDDHPQIENLAESNANRFTREALRKIVIGEVYSEQDWELLLKLLCDGHTDEEISFEKVKKWMERAHNRCRFLANTLISEKEVVECLNQVISGLIIGVTFIMWLLLTNLATTSVLVLIASPFLAATFIFGDTCKSFFQGLIFIYVVHPFDVGDLCLVDEQLLEVKRISAWTTTFSKVRTIGMQQDVIYPNSALAAKDVINHKTEFDWNDSIEFSLSLSDDEAANNLKSKIETYIDTQSERFTPNFLSVDFLEIGEKAKIAVHIKHNAQTEGRTYFECLKEKEKRRFKVALYLQNLVNEYEPKLETEEK